VSLASIACCQVEVSAKGPITHPEESYRVWCVEISLMMHTRQRGGLGPLGGGGRCTMVTKTTLNTTRNLQFI